MQYNQEYVPDEAHEVNEPTEQHSCLPILDCPASGNTLLQRESVEKFQKTKQAMNSLYSKCHRSSGISLTNRRERNRERERMREKSLQEAFNLLRGRLGRAS